MSENTGICLQVGIMDSPELIYLAVPSWKHRRTLPPMFQLPEIVTDMYTDWEYFGMDADPCAIAFLINEYNQPNVHWVQGCLSPCYFHGESLTLLPSWMSVKNIVEEKPSKVWIPKITLDTLITELHLKTLDVLWLDIEGCEYTVLEAYSWRLKPAYISTEVHTYPKAVEPDILANKVAKMKALVTEQGYKIVIDKPTNIREGLAYTHELQFLRKDLCQI